MSNELIEAIFGSTAVPTDDAVLVDALCDVETALARACARVGLIQLPIALEIGAVCESVRRLDRAELARRSVAGGNPVIPLVAEIRAAVAARAGTEAAHAVHLGATSQDILDTALMLVAKQALGVIIADLDECGDAAARLASAHRTTPMAGRTLLQQAVPTTLGALAAVWGSGLDRAHARLTDLRARLPVQLGGAAGTMAGWYPRGLDVLAAFADELDLAEPDGVWHTERSVITELAGALGAAAATIAKVATDIVLLSQSEVGELHERAPGGSSAMAHKQNPIAAVTARAAAAQAPGLVATLLSQAPELQRGAGPWHAEWPALLMLLQYTGGGAARLWRALDLDVDAAAMAANLARMAASVDTSDLGHASDLVDRYLDRRRR